MNESSEILSGELRDHTSLGQTTACYFSFFSAVNFLMCAESCRLRYLVRIMMDLVAPHLHFYHWSFLKLVSRPGEIGGWVTLITCTHQDSVTKNVAYVHLIVNKATKQNCQTSQNQSQKSLPAAHLVQVREHNETVCETCLVAAEKTNKIVFRSIIMRHWGWDLREFIYRGCACYNMWLRLQRMDLLGFNSANVCV